MRGVVAARNEEFEHLFTRPTTTKPFELVEMLSQFPAFTGLCPSTPNSSRMTRLISMHLKPQVATETCEHVFWLRVGLRTSEAGDGNENLLLTMTYRGNCVAHSPLPCEDYDSRSIVDLYGDGNIFFTQALDFGSPSRGESCLVSLLVTLLLNQ